MIDRKWLTNTMTIQGTLSYSDNLTSVFEWDGVPIRSTHGFEYEKHSDKLYEHSVYANGREKVAFANPKDTIKFVKKHEGKSNLYTSVENANLKLVYIREYDDPTPHYFIPSKRGRSQKQGVGKGFFVFDNENAVWYVNAKHTENGTVYDLHPITNRSEQVVRVTDGDKIAYDGEYVPLQIIQSNLSSVV